MRPAYQALAYLICALVALQAASHAWVSAGLGQYIAQGGTLDFSADGPPPFPEALGFAIHGMNGMYVIPIVAVLLLGVGFVAKLPGAVSRAAIVLGLVALQVTFGLFGHSLTTFAFLHGVNALLLFGAAFVAARSVRAPGTVSVADHATAGRAS